MPDTPPTDTRQENRPRGCVAICREEGCARQARVRGLCRLHYHRWWMSRQFHYVHQERSNPDA